MENNTMQNGQPLPSHTIHTQLPPEELHRRLQKIIHTSDLTLRVPRGYPFAGTLSPRGFTIRRNMPGGYGRPQLLGRVEPEGSGTAIRVSHQQPGSVMPVRRLIAGLGGLVVLVLVIITAMTGLSNPFLLIPIGIIGLVAIIVYWLAGRSHPDATKRFDEDCRELERLLTEGE
jgi:hypothetical protein